MPSANPGDTPLAALTNGVSPSSRNHSTTDLTRKPHEKTISGVFAYTNGTDVDTGLPEHRLEQYKGLKNNLGAIGGTGTNGTGQLANGTPRGGTSAGMGSVGRNRSHSKTGSTHTIGSAMGADRSPDANGSIIGSSRASNSLDGPTRRMNGDITERHAGNWPLTSDFVEAKRVAPGLGRTQSDLSQQHHQPSLATHGAPADGSKPDVHHAGGSGYRHNTVHRFSSPAAPSESLLHDIPRLTQRHTLQVPRISSTINRDSRDFSFSTGDEALMASGRFSPVRDNVDTNVPRHRRPSFGLIRRATRSMASDMHPDEVAPDDDAARWTEIVKQKRASRRKRKEEEDDDRVIVGKKVEEGHVNWVTAYNMLTGIRFTVSRTNAKMDRELTDADFDAKHKFSFDVTGNELTPSAKYDFKFKDYSPWVFRHLRSIFGLDPADYLMSLTSKYILSELGSPGKSGSFFYFSRDYKYIIKTIHHAEHKLLRKILREYYSHVRDNPNTLVSQFYGLHRVKIPYGRKIHFVVMNNLFPPHRDIHQTFDLKGSTVGRDFKEDDLANNPRATLKDLNWLRRDLHLEFQESVKRAFVEQIIRDVRLLQKLHIMDYSLLVGMHDLEKGNEENVRETTLKVFQPGGERDEDGIDGMNMLVRTPSRLENARKARELRQTLKNEKPTPMSLVAAKMPDEMKSSDMRQFKLFYSDGGGVRATHEDGSPGAQIYYLGVIDCLTHYGFVKRIEHFWKGLSNSRTQISPIPPEAYGERFINFIQGITMTKEEAERRKTMEGEERQSVDNHHMLHHHHDASAAQDSALQDSQHNEKGSSSPIAGSSEAVEQTMAKAQREADKSAKGKGRKESESEVPDRELKTVTVPDDEAPVQRNSTTLPVVEEVGEANSDTSRSPSKEKEMTSSSNSRTSGTQQASSSASNYQANGSIDTSHTEHEPIRSPESRQEQQFYSPMEYPDEQRNKVNAAFRPISHSSQTRDKPPRLGSGLIPQLAPLSTEYDSGDRPDVGRAV